MTINWSNIHDELLKATHSTPQEASAPEVDVALDSVLAMVSRLAPKPVTKYTSLNTEALQEYAAHAAHELLLSGQALSTFQLAAESVRATDFQLPGLYEDLASFEAKVKTLKGQIKAREAEVIPMHIQEGVLKAKSEADAARDRLGNMLTEIHARLPLGASRVPIAHLENSAGEIHQLIVNRSADAGFEVTDPFAFFATLPESHTKLFKVSVTANTEYISRAQINDWFEAELKTGTLRGVERKPRTLVTVAEEGGLFSLRQLDPTEAKPERLVKLNW